MRGWNEEEAKQQLDSETIQVMDGEFWDAAGQKLSSSSKMVGEFMELS